MRNLQDVTNFEATPLENHNLSDSTYSALMHCANTHGDKPALTFFTNSSNLKSSYTWSYRELFSDITRAANVFSSLSIKDSDVIAFILPNLPETHFTIWGGEAAGRVMAINPLFDAEQITELLNTAKAKIVVTLAPTPGSDIWEKVESQLDKLHTIRDIIWVGMEPYSDEKFKLYLHGLAQRALLLNQSHNIYNLRSLMKDQPSNHLINKRVINEHDQSSLFCTGGTTGLPKIAIRTHGNEVFNAWAIANSISPLQPGTVIFCGLPLFHVNAQLVTGLMPWTHGFHVIIGTPQGYRGDGVLNKFWDIVDHFKINLFSGVPTIFSALLDNPPTTQCLKSLQYAICGAAPMPVELLREFESKIGVKILEGYGLTEGTCVSSLNPVHGEKRIGSIGIRLPYQNIKAVVLSEEGNYIRDSMTNEVGIIAIQGPNVFTGYLNRSHNHGIWIDIDGQLWFNTGDLGRQDVDGYFWLTGRKKDIIIRGGHNIDPKMIEETLQTHPAVALAAAIGSPDAYAGEVPVVYVQLSNGHNITPEKLMKYASQNIPERAAVPKRIEILESLPLTPVGKIFKPALQHIEIKRVIYHEALSAGFDSIQVDVRQDPKRGNLALIKSHPNQAKLASSLGKYNIQIEWV
ncbi:MAG: acyl-CoA synthetase [Pseudomonas sp.]|uniref:acyl-CoA synthetase n=1 Tax=Pseudomonas sp. FEMGT703P TaxID=2080764 RepID=UPI000CB7CA13|nr:acyl-CoA synthetase [Pseudomonas sp. FEMGT703P]PJE43117.1 MAG: acyl-CoA synthetase [Pseudomonas sp.] [Pseudomonas sp. FEMGT703P]